MGRYARHFLDGKTTHVIKELHLVTCLHVCLLYPSLSPTSNVTSQRDVEKHFLMGRFLFACMLPVSLTSLVRHGTLLDGFLTSRWVLLLGLPPVAYSFATFQDQFPATFFHIFYTESNLELHINIGIFFIPLSISRISI